MKIGAAFQYLNEQEWLHLAMRSVEDSVEEFFISISRRVFESNLKSRYELELPYLQSLQEKFGKKITIIEGNWSDAGDSEQALLDRMIDEGFEYALTFDADEIPDPDTLKLVVKLLEAGAGNVGLHCKTYFKRPWFVVNPNEQHVLGVATRLKKGMKTVRRWKTNNNIAADRLTTEGPLVYADLPFHHFSWVRSTDEKILQKVMSVNGIGTAQKQAWFENTWKKWNRSTKNFHPVVGSLYEKINEVSISDLPLAGRMHVYENSPKIVAEKGDTFWTIAEKRLGSGAMWAEVRDANPGIGVVEGAKIAIPEMFRI